MCDSGFQIVIPSSNQSVYSSYLLTVDNFNFFSSSLKMTKLAIIDEELCKYLWENDQSSLDLSSECEEFIGGRN